LEPLERLCRSNPHDVRGMSALPPITDIRRMERYACLRLNKVVGRDFPVERSGRRSCHSCSCSPFARSLCIDICLKYLEIPTTIQIEILKGECRSSNPAWSANQSGLCVCPGCVARIRAVGGLLEPCERSLDSRIAKSADDSAESLRARSRIFPNYWRRESETGSIIDCVAGASVLIAR
jgi:hypothetical protein